MRYLSPGDRGPFEFGNPPWPRGNAHLRPCMPSGRLTQVGRPSRLGSMANGTSGHALAMPRPSRPIRAQPGEALPMTPPRDRMGMLGRPQICIPWLMVEHVTVALVVGGLPRSLLVIADTPAVDVTRDAAPAKGGICVV